MPVRHKRCEFDPCVWKICWRRVQYSCLENPTDRGAWWAAVHRVTQSRIPLKRLSTCTPIVPKGSLNRLKEMLL